MNAVECVLAKRRQAWEHLKAFNRAVGEFLDERPCRIAGEFNDDCTQYIFRAYDIQPVPETVSLIAGDVIHNARACLDHLAWEIAHNPKRETAFPIWNSRKGGQDPTIPSGISPSHQAALVSVQPYIISPTTPTNSFLAILHALDITDKHKTVLASIASIEGNVHGRPHGCRGSEPTWDYEWGALKNGGPVARVRCTMPSPEMKVDFDLSPSVSLDGAGAAHRPEDARDMLWRLWEEVRKTVAAFEPF
jgi:hypothetical protein